MSLLRILCGGLLTLASLPAQGPLHTYPGEHSEAYAGEAVAYAGDLDQDGEPDWIYGESGFAGAAGARTGRLTAISGGTGRVIWRTEGTNANDWLGTTIAMIGDLDADGAQEWVAGSPYAGPNGPGAGVIFVGDGRTGAILRTHVGQADQNGDGFGAYLGYHLAGVPDVNGDGLNDYLVGAPGDLFDGPNCLAVDQAGAVELRSGADGSLIRSVVGNPTCNGAGATCAGLADINGDGMGEILVGFPESSVGTGRMQLIDGATGQVLRTHVGTEQADFFGTTVNGVGDVDRDGVPDYAASADNSSGPGGSFGAGYVRIFSGRTGLLLLQLDGRQSQDLFGRSFGPAGDFDRDGFGDIYVGAPFDAVGGGAAGRITIFSGATAAELFTVQSPNAVAFYGFARRTAIIPDVDGDQRPEILAGDWNDDRAGSDAGAATVWGSGARRHWVSQSLLSLDQASSVQLRVDLGAAAAGWAYAMVGSLTGTGPTAVVPGVTVPLDADFWLALTADPNTSPFQNGFGLLDANGRATATFNWPAGLPPALDGVRHWSAALVADPMGNIAVSRPARLAITQ